MVQHKIKYIHSEELIKEADKNPAVKKRAAMTHELIKSYGLLDEMTIIKPKKCNAADLRGYHSCDYIALFDRYTVREDPDKATNDCNSDSDTELEDNEVLDDSYAEEYGLAFDCPTWPNIKNYLYTIAGATMTACDELCKSDLENPELIINWTGGWHHALHDKASGYCYVNDIVLGILVLRRQYQRVLYIDMDVHHGDGVQQAFEATKHVFTLSFHKYESGFFPGTGKTSEIGINSAKGYAANFPFVTGISGELYTTYFKRITKQVIEMYKPDACVIQCGGDVIVGDPLGWTDIKPQEAIDCILFILNYKLPTVLLGGGGYNFTNTSRFWTILTGRLCGKTLGDDIPDENEYFLKYGPGYNLYIDTNLFVKDQNTKKDLDATALTIEENLRKHNVGNF